MKQTDLDDYALQARKPSFSNGVSRIDKKRNVGVVFSSRTLYPPINGQYLVVGANPKRTYLRVNNMGANAVYLSFGRKPEDNGDNGLFLDILTPTIATANFLEFANQKAVPQNEVYVLATGGTKLVVIEGYEQN